MWSYVGVFVVFASTLLSHKLITRTSTDGHKSHSFIFRWCVKCTAVTLHLIQNRQVKLISCPELQSIEWRQAFKINILQRQDICWLSGYPRWIDCINLSPVLSLAFSLIENRQACGGRLPKHWVPLFVRLINQNWPAWLFFLLVCTNCPLSGKNMHFSLNAIYQLNVKFKTGLIWPTKQFWTNLHRTN